MDDFNMTDGRRIEKVWQFTLKKVTTGSELHCGSLYFSVLTENRFDSLRFAFEISSYHITVTRNPVLQLTSHGGDYIRTGLQALSTDL